MSRNIILCGPPGTGKTFKAKHLAVKLLEEGVNPEQDEISELLKETVEFSRDVVKEKFKEKINNSIKMVSFHQSFSYEDFVEGKTLGEGGGIKFEDGVLKAFIEVKTIDENERTQFFMNWVKKFKTDKEAKFDFDLKCSSTYKYYQIKNIRYKYGTRFKEEREPNSEFDKIEFNFSSENRNDFSVSFPLTNIKTQLGDNNQNSSLGYRILEAAKIIKEDTIDSKLNFEDYLGQDYLTPNYKKNSSNQNIVIKYKSSGGSDQFYTETGNENTLKTIDSLKESFLNNTKIEKENQSLNITNEISNYLLKEFEKTNQKNKNSNKNSTDGDSKKVLIIDEINRGNVSAIFGELISLLGQGEGESKKITLSSNKEFSLPDNLYIIGTMNTADRSAEQMDTAMRRRFEFVDLLPDEKLLEEIDGQAKIIKDINLKTILKTINDRIKVLLGKDYCIGHSYFMKVTDLASLKRVMYNEIIPLLEQYFYNDIEKIRWVLSKDFVTEETKPLSVFKTIESKTIDLDIEASYKVEYLEDDARFISAMIDI